MRKFPVGESIEGCRLKDIKLTPDYLMFTFYKGSAPVRKRYYCPKNRRASETVVLNLEHIMSVYLAKSDMRSLINTKFNSYYDYCKAIVDLFKKQRYQDKYVTLKTLRGKKGYAILPFYPYFIQDSNSKHFLRYSEFEKQFNNGINNKRQ